MRNSSARKSLAVLASLSILALTVVGCTTPAGKSAAPTANVGQTVTVDNLKYTVTAVNKAKEVGVPGNSFKVKDGDYVVVDLNVANTGQKTTDFDGDMAKLYDTDNQLYELNLEAAAATCNACESQGVKNVWFGKLEPGEAATTKAVFEVPAGAKGMKVELRSAQIGSEKTAVVSLGI